MERGEAEVSRTQYCPELVAALQLFSLVPLADRSPGACHVQTTSSWILRSKTVRLIVISKSSAYMPFYDSNTLNCKPDDRASTIGTRGWAYH